MKRVNKAILGTVVGVSFFTSVFAQDDPIVIDDLSLSELNDQIERVEDEFYRVFNLSIEEEHLRLSALTGHLRAPTLRSGHASPTS